MLDQAWGQFLMFFSFTSSSSTYTAESVIQSHIVPSLQACWPWLIHLLNLFNFCIIMCGGKLSLFILRIYKWKAISPANDVILWHFPLTDKNPQKEELSTLIPTLKTFLTGKTGVSNKQDSLRKPGQLAGLGSWGGSDAPSWAFGKIHLSILIF